MTEDGGKAVVARSVVERYVREVLNGDGPGTSDELISNEMLRQKVDGFRSAFPDLRVVTHQVLVDGDFVGVSATGRGTHHGIFQGVPPTGRSWTATCTALYRVVDGRIADFWINWDLLSILEQVGGVQRSVNASA